MPSPWWCYCPAPVPALTGVNAETIPNARGPTRSPPVGGPSPACLSWWPQDRDPCRESRHSCPPGPASKVVGKPDTSGATVNAEKQKRQSRFLLWKERFPPREAERGESWQRWKPQPPYSLPASGPAPLLPCTSLATPRPPAGKGLPSTCSVDISFLRNSRTLRRRGQKVQVGDEMTEPHFLTSLPPFLPTSIPPSPGGQGAQGDMDSRCCLGGWGAGERAQWGTCLPSRGLTWVASPASA